MNEIIINGIALAIKEYDDQKLKPIFDSIVKKLEAKYVQSNNVQLGLVEIP